MVREEKKWNHTKCSFKTSEGRRRVEKKFKTNKQNAKNRAMDRN